MRLLQKMCFVVLASGLALGQATATNSGSAGTGSVADELKALREAISQQQKQISQQQQQIQTLEQQLENKNVWHTSRRRCIDAYGNDARQCHCRAGNRKTKRVSAVLPHWRHGFHTWRIRGF